MITRYYIDDIDEENYDFLFIKSQDRADYNFLFETIYAQCKYSKLDLVVKRSIRVNTFYI